MTTPLQDIGYVLKNTELGSVSFMENIMKTIRRYKKFDSEKRFLMLTDKLIILLTVANAGLIGSTSYDIRKIKEGDESQEEKNAKIIELNESIVFINKIFDELKAEVEALEDYIQSDTKSTLTQMSGKLDEVLLGPYYQAGRELMANSKTDFEHLHSTHKDI